MATVERFCNNVYQRDKTNWLCLCSTLCKFSHFFSVKYLFGLLAWQKWYKFMGKPSDVVLLFRHENHSSEVCTARTTRPGDLESTYMIKSKFCLSVVIGWDIYMIRSRNIDLNIFENFSPECHTMRYSKPSDVQLHGTTQGFLLRRAKSRGEKPQIFAAVIVMPANLSCKYLIPCRCHVT